MKKSIIAALGISLFHVSVAMANDGTLMPEFDQMQCSYSIQEDDEISPSKVCDDGRFTYFEFSQDAIFPVYKIIDISGKKVTMLVNTHFLPTGYLVAEAINSEWRILAGNRQVVVTRQSPVISDEKPAPPMLPVRGILNIDRYVPVILTTPINVRRSGMVEAVANQTVYSWGGRTVVVPIGSKVIGFHEKSSDLDQARLAICVTTVVLPDGKQLRPQDPAVKQKCLGYAVEVTGELGLPVSDLAQGGLQILIRPLVDLEVE